MARAPKQRTHCMRGHVLDETNTYFYPDGRKECKVCRRERSREQHKTRVRNKKPRKVPVETLRDLVNASGFTPSEVAERLEWRDRGKLDVNRVYRVLGYRADGQRHDGKGNSAREHVQRKSAQYFLDMLGADPALLDMDPENPVLCRECGAEMIRDTPDGLCRFCRIEMGLERAA